MAHAECSSVVDVHGQVLAQSHLGYTADEVWLHTWPGTRQTQDQYVASSPARAQLAS